MCSTNIRLSVSQYITSLCMFRYLCRFLLYWNGSSASWIITLMSIERFLAIYFPIRIKIFTSKTKVILAMVNIFAFAAAINLHFFWTYELKPNKSAKYCVSVSKYSNFLTQYWPWLTISFYSLVPLTILISTSTATVLKIVHSNYVRKHSMNISDGGVKLTSVTAAVSSLTRLTNDAFCIQIQDTSFRQKCLRLRCSDFSALAD